MKAIGYLSVVFGAIVAIGSTAEGNLGGVILAVLIELISTAVICLSRISDRLAGIESQLAEQNRFRQRLYAEGRDPRFAPSSLGEEPDDEVALHYLSS